MPLASGGVARKPFTQACFPASWDAGCPPVWRWSRTTCKWKESDEASVSQTHLGCPDIKGQAPNCPSFRNPRRGICPSHLAAFGQKGLIMSDDFPRRCRGETVCARIHATGTPCRAFGNRHSLEAKCIKCGNVQTVLGNSERSRRAVLAHLRDTCPLGENNFYVDA